MSATPPPDKADFRTAVIESHWNDPPHTIFHQHVASDHPVNADFVIHFFQGILDDCKQSTPAAQKRIMADTEKRLEWLFEKLRTGGIDDQTMASVDLLCQELEAHRFPEALQVHTKLLTTSFEQHGTWLLGIKRLIDMYQQIEMK